MATLDLNYEGDNEGDGEPLFLIVVQCTGTLHDVGN